MKKVLAKLVKKQIVVDTRSSWIYIGTLEEVLDSCLKLSQVDVHDSSETSTPKERYVLDSKTSGIKANREAVFINLEYVVSFSLLDDVIRFD